MSNTSATTTSFNLIQNDYLTTSEATSSSANITARELEDFKIADFVNLYVPPALVVLGDVCNILAFLVMRSHYFRSLSTSVYMSACAANDAVSLIISLTPHWLYVNFPWTFVRSSHSHYMCKFFNFYGYFNCDYTIVLTAVMTADRAFVIMNPIKASTVDLIKRAKITIIVLMTLVAAKEFHFLFYSDIVPPERTDRLCDVILINMTYKNFSKNIWPWLHITFLTLCFLVIIASNTIITVNVWRSENMEHFNNLKSGKRNNVDNSVTCVRSETPSCSSSASVYGGCNTSQSTSRTHSGYRGSNCSQSASRSKWQQITFMLLAQSFTLIILTYPFSIHLVISPHVTDLYTDPKKKATNQLVFSAVFYLLYSNKCVNFFLYCITGSRFRCALRDLCCCRLTGNQFSVQSMIKETAMATSQTTLCSISLKRVATSSLENQPNKTE